MSEFKKLGHNLYTLRAGSVGAVVSFGDKATDVAYSTTQAPASIGGGGYGIRGEHVPWGVKDLALAEMHKLACESPNKWRLIFTRTDFIIGAGLVGRTKIVENGKLKIEDVYNDSLEEFRDRLNLDEYCLSAAAQIAFAYTLHVKLTLASNNEVESLEVVDNFDIRAKRPEPTSKKITAFVLNPNFGRKAYRRGDSVELPAFDPRNPTKYPVSIIQVRRPIPGQKFYSFGDWWGTKMVTQVANKVPVFDDSGLNNGYNIKYHISIPDDYFEKEGLTEKEQEALKEETLTAMGESLSGIDNVDKVLYTFHKVDVSGKEITGIRITPLKNEMSDTAFNEKFKTYNAASTAGHGLIPVVAGIETGNSKFGGSGKELESAANYIQNFITPTDRELVLRPIKYALRIEGFPPELHFGFQNIEMYTYDVTPAGTTQNPNDDAPTN